MKFIQTLQGVARWYFTATGVVFNLFSAVSLVGLFMGFNDLSFLPVSSGLLDPLQNIAICSRALSGTQVSFETEIPFTSLDAQGRKREMVLIGPRSFISGVTKDGHKIVTSQAKAQSPDTTDVQHLAFEVNEKGEILRCLPSPLSAQARMTECLAAAGTYESKGDCLLEIQLPSDCQVMGGKLEGERTCRVPGNGRLLKPALPVSEAK